MATYSADFLGKGTYYVDVTETSTNSAANTSVVSFTVRLVGNNTAWDGTTRYWSVTYDGVLVNAGGSFSYDFRSNNTPTLGSGSATVTHNADGSKTVAVVSGFSGGSASGNFALTDFVRLPSAPATAPTITRSSDGATIDLTSATASSAVSLSKYEYQWSTDQTTWTTVTPMNTTTATSAVASPSFTATSTIPYYFQTRGVSSEGNGAWSPTGTSFGVPSAPASVTTSRTARSVTVTVGASATNGGTAITNYYVQYSTDSGSTWSTAQVVSGGLYTYNNLTPALTYVFRAYSTNAVGSSATTSSSSLFVPAGGKRYDGTSFTSTTVAKRWSGSAWVDLTTAKRWNGSAWVDLS